MSETIEYRPVGAEARGLARVFRQQVVEVDAAFQAALAPILAPLRARLRRHPKLRPEQVAEVERVYTRTIPQKFRVGRIEGAKTKVEFALREVRLTASWLIDHGWNDPSKEKGVSLCRYVLAVQSGRLIEGWTPLASISPHALGRWHERSGQRDHDALFGDISMLSNLDSDVTEVPTAGGRWLGVSDTASNDGQPCRIFNCRTWLAN
jgi:hypothetical protein